MNAIFLEGPRSVRVGELPMPEPRGDELLLQISAVGICGSDLHYYLKGGIGSDIIKEPFVPGHEFSARLLQDDAELNLSAGQLVAVDPASPCGKCEWCLSGYENLCPDVIFAGAPPHHGAMTEFYCAGRSRLFPVPENISPAEAALLETLGVAIHATDLAKIEENESVAILGSGPIGLCVLQLVTRKNRRAVFSIDPLDYRAEIAKKLGAVESGQDVRAVADWTDGRGVDVVIEATNSDEGFRHAVESVRTGGRIVLVGIPQNDHYRIPASLARRKGLTVKWARRMGQVYPRAIEMVSAGKIDLRTIVTHEFPLEFAARAFEMQSECRDEVLKSVLYPSRET